MYWIRILSYTSFMVLLRTIKITCLWIKHKMYNAYVTFSTLFGARKGICHVKYLFFQQP